MKHIFLLLATACLSIFTTNLQAMDLVKDRAIIETLTSEKFANVLIHYSYNGKEYPLRIIWNPNEETLWGKYLRNPTKLSLMIIGNVPIPLARIIEDLVLEIRGSYKDTAISLKDGKPEKGWDSVEPVYIAESIDDAINDQIIRDTMKSKSFVNKLIYYYYKKNYYRVRLLHNPEGRTLTSTKTYDLNNYGNKVYTLSWNKKYGIMFEYGSPQDLEDHVSDQLRTLSYYDWFFNYTLSNGTFVTFSYSPFGANYTDTWDLDTWYDFTENFK